MIGSSGDAVGANPASEVVQGASASYVYYIPNDPQLEGSHLIHPGPGYRDAVDHGLFGTLEVEPAGSTYLDVSTGKPLASGWAASIVPPTNKAFREYVLAFHEIGNEEFKIRTRTGDDLPQLDPITTAYRPGARAMNYRSEPFFDRLSFAPTQEAQGYGSYTFGDPATPMPRSYQADPTKIRIIHAGSEMMHVFHLHGGGIRWRYNPQADHTYNYADTGLKKFPVQMSDSSRLDSQAFGPGEAYDLEIEGGAGGVQQGAGEFLFHCHIASHYVSGMWSFWRVFDTLQPDLKPLPDRAPPPEAVTSEGLIGKTMPDGTTLTAQNLDEWIKPQLPPQGVPIDGQDSTVWNYATQGNLYLGEPEDKGPWPDLLDDHDSQWVPGHPGLMAGDTPVG